MKTQMIAIAAMMLLVVGCSDGDVSKTTLSPSDGENPIPFVPEDSRASVEVERPDEMVVEAPNAEAKPQNTIFGKTQAELVGLLGRPTSVKAGQWVYPTFALSFDAAGRVSGIDKSFVEPVRVVSEGGKVVNLQSLMEPGKVTMIDFYADWCGPCKQLSPKLEGIATSDPNVVLRKVDIVDWGTPVAKQFKIQSIPNVWVFDGAGRRVGTPTPSFTATKNNVAAAKKQSGL